MKKYTFAFFLVLCFFVVLVTSFLFYSVHAGDIAVFNPKGIIALQERNLIFISLSLMFLLAIPALFLTFFMAWKYRASNSKAHYDPIANHSTFFQLSLWTILSVTALILSLVTWKATHQLDPRKPLASSIKPLVIQVIALQWKWLFIYPAQHIATVNFIQFPVHTPILFELTADDAPMNSFWIPQLSGQIYAMTGMQTQLHIMTDTPGDFAGSAAEISGAGFASMRFVARASSQANFDTWVFSVKKSQSPLSASAYNTLLAPSENNPVAFYASTEENLYNTILMRYMTPSPTMTMQQMNAIQDMKMK